MVRVRNRRTGRWVELPHPEDEVITDKHMSEHLSSRSVMVAHDRNTSRERWFNCYSQIEDYWDDDGKYFNQTSYDPTAPTIAEWNELTNGSVETA